MAPSLSEIREAQGRSLALSEAISARALWAGSSGDKTDDGPLDPSWRPVNAIFGANNPNRSPTDIPEGKHRKMLNVCLFAYQQNPLARMFVDLTVDYVIGSGVHVVSPRKNVQNALDVFWSHPHNRMDERVYHYALESSVYGELLTTFSFEEGGLMTVNSVSPGYIHSVVPSSTDFSRFVEVRLNAHDARSPQALGGTAAPITLKLPESDDRGLLSGDALYLAINRVSDATRGLSDLLTMVDLLSDLDQFNYNAVQRSRHMLQWFWDVTYEGANREQLKEYRDEMMSEAWHPGALRLHNSMVKWQPLSPQMADPGLKDIQQAVYSMALSGARVPMHWTGFGGGVARSGAEASNEPTYRRLITRQTIIQRYIRDLVNLQLDHLVSIGKLPMVARRDFKVVMPAIAVRDLQRLTGAIRPGVEAISQAVAEGLLDENAGREVVNQLLANIAASGAFNVDSLLRKEYEPEEEDDGTPQDGARQRQQRRRPAAGRSPERRASGSGSTARAADPGARERPGGGR